MNMLSIVVPTLNEKNNVEHLIQQIGDALTNVTPYEILFIDDSLDETPEELKRLCGIYGHVRYVHRTGEKGLASAVVKGFSLAQGSILAVMDADLQHPPQLLADMYLAIKNGADIVLPSRYVQGGKDEGLNWFRKIASSTAKFVGKVILPSLRKISDPTSGYFMLKRDVIVNSKLHPLGWKILMEVLVMGNYKKVVELPYAFHKRIADESKISFKVTLQFFAHIFSLLLRSERERRFYLFMLIGLSGVFLDMVAFLLLSSFLPWHINVLVTISAFIAMCCNYLLNRNLTFARNSSKQHGHTGREFLRFVGVSSIGILIKNVIVYILSFSGVAGLISNLIGIFSASLSNYFLSAGWVFAREMPAVTTHKEFE
jgi:dolichol-phosphate mannosyltransferase